MIKKKLMTIIDSLLLQIKYLIMKGKRCSLCQILYILCRVFMNNIKFYYIYFTLRNRLRDRETCMRSFTHLFYRQLLKSSLFTRHNYVLGLQQYMKETQFPIIIELSLPGRIELNKTGKFIQLGNWSLNSNYLLIPKRALSTVPC